MSGSGDSRNPDETRGEEPVGSPESPDGDRSPDGEGDRRRRRSIWLLLLLLLAIAGGGIGTFVLEDRPETSPSIRTPTETVERAATPSATGSVSLTADANATLLRAEGVVPGDEGVSRLALRNVGAVEGELAVANLTVSDRENEITGGEGAVDESQTEGELAENLLIRLSVQYSGAETVRVFGDDTFVPLADVAGRNRTVGALAAGEEVTVVLEWRLPAETGNEVQSDTAVFDIVFGLRDPTGGTPGQ